MPSQDPNGYSLLNKNSLGIPAVCADYIEVGDIAQLKNVLNTARSSGQSVLVLGEGTNVVFARDTDNLVIRPLFLGTEIVQTLEDEVVIRVGAGENWHELVCWSLSQGFFGLENLALIPGSCGAAPVQNIGAYGVELNQFVERVEYVNLKTLEQVSLTSTECEFGYRESRFKHELQNRAVITHVHLKLSRQPGVNITYPAIRDYLDQNGLSSTPENVFDAVCSTRRSKLPDIRKIPNVGSFFKNPIVTEEHFAKIQSIAPDCPGYSQDSGAVKIPAAWLIDRRNWKGKMFDGVGIHQSQALVLINPGHRAGEQVLQVARNIQSDIRQAFEIDLEIEPRVI